VGDIQLFSCAAHDFLTSRPDADHQKPAPKCSTCGQPTIHSSPATAQEIIHRKRMAELPATASKTG
jgi:hypothetical protein